MKAGPNAPSKIQPFNRDQSKRGVSETYPGHEGRRLPSSVEERMPWPGGMAGVVRPRRRSQVRFSPRRGIGPELCRRHLFDPRRFQTRSGFH